MSQASITLVKEGGASLFQENNWVPCWLTLNSDHTLKISTGDASQIIGIIKLNEFITVSSNTQDLNINKANAFGIMVVNHWYKFYVGSPVDQLSWFNQLKQQTCTRQQRQNQRRNNMVHGDGSNDNNNNNNNNNNNMNNINSSNDNNDNNNDNLLDVSSLVNGINDLSNEHMEDEDRIRDGNVNGINNENDDSGGSSNLNVLSQSFYNLVNDEMIASELQTQEFRLRGNNRRNVNMIGRLHDNDVVMTSHRRRMGRSNNNNNNNWSNRNDGARRPRRPQRQQPRQPQRQPQRQNGENMNDSEIAARLQAQVWNEENRIDDVKDNGNSGRLNSNLNSNSNSSSDSHSNFSLNVNVNSNERNSGRQANDNENANPMHSLNSLNSLDRLYAADLQSQEWNRRRNNNNRNNRNNGSNNNHRNNSHSHSNSNRRGNNSNVNGSGSGNSRAVHNCSVCLEGLNSSGSGGNGRITTLPCAHVFHEVCINQWLLQNRTCPICRTAINRR